MNLRKNKLRWVILSIVVIIIDLGTKYFALQSLSYARPVEVFPFFNLTLLHNYGAAFSFLSNANPTCQVILLSGIALVASIFILVRLTYLPKDKNLIAYPLLFILGGALGNVYDRIVHGYVVDFLDFHINNYHWPAFNIADSAICIGVVILILVRLRSGIT